jgi:hypothetical protein
MQKPYTEWRRIYKIMQEHEPYPDKEVGDRL